ncbi:TonB-dependent siderophore receptor [Phenylobacterium sp.]|uniref:TonB-dependent siderophore receptor n=1 Tax=Phenylobacterium sp. TaxID=1871053 RepID=UPI002CC77273|nr:TonB-dependent siderophore receptor [Phenylobacterium sp.]HVI32276.1 TonB-dependent siderophore receptor [Phenylobacterium sp.]
MHLRRRLLSATVLAGALAAALPAFAEDDAGTVAEVLVTARRDDRTSKGATGLDLSLSETPQAVTIVDRQFMDSFGLDEVNQVLSLVTGVNVEAVETDRTYYNARGFDIKSMQVDGVGLPFTWNVVGALDTAGYEKVEVVRGANGLLTGTGNPSGTINYVRKRPTNDRRADAELTVGSWGRVRGEADVSGPFTASGLWAGRLVAAVEDKGSHLDLYGSDRTFVYGVVEGQVGDNAILTAGYARQDNKADGVLWGALPMQYADGTQTRYDPSTTTSIDWTEWDTLSNTAFVELVYALPRDWEAKAIVTYNDFDERSVLFYTYGNPDAGTGLGLFGWPANYEQNSNRLLFDASLAGPLEAFGRGHQAMLGVSLSDMQSGYLSYPAPAADPAWGALPAFPGWTGEEIAEPVWGAPHQEANWTYRMNRVFGVLHLDLADSLKAIVGFNAIDVKAEGDSFGESMASEEDAVSPYVGVTWTFAPGLSLYASYSDIFEPQGESDADFRPLGAAQGDSYEAGLKGQWLGGRLYAAATVFKARQDNYAEYAGATPEGISYYRGVDTRSKGFEIEVAGEVVPGLKVSGGYTQLGIEGPGGEEVRTFIPRKTVVLSAVWEPQALPKLELGGNLKWQDDIHLENWLGDIRQDSYATLNLMAAWQVTDRVKATVRVNNVTDEAYLASLYWDQAFYAPTRNIQASLRYSF